MKRSQSSFRKTRVKGSRQKYRMDFSGPLLVIGYVNPDLDGVSCAIAYSEFLNTQGIDAVPRILGACDTETEYVLSRFRVKKPKRVKNDDGFSRVALVDASNAQDLEQKVNPEKVIEIIDHRSVNDADQFPNAKIQIERVGAAATLVAEKFMKSGVLISKSSAILLHSAILSNTIHFRSTVTTDRDRTSAKWLNHTAKLDSMYWKELFMAKSDLSGNKLRDRMEGDLKSFTIAAKQLAVAQIEMIGGERLVDAREKEILRILDRFRRNNHCDFVFLNVIELDRGAHVVVTGDASTKQLLEKALGVHFSGNVAKHGQVVMRKQIMPMIKRTLEGKKENG